jgi:hypothetical protein
MSGSVDEKTEAGLGNNNQNALQPSIDSQFEEESKDKVTGYLVKTSACHQHRVKPTALGRDQLPSSSSDNSRVSYTKNQYSDTSSDSGGRRNEGCHRKYHGENAIVKRRKKRKRPTDPKDKAMKQKAADIDKALTRSYKRPSESSLSDDSAEKESDANIESIINTRKTLRELAISENGLINDELRRRGWPRLVGVDMLTETCILPTQEEVEAHKSYRQVVMDVDRSLKRFPPGIGDEERPGIQDQLTRLIVRVLMKHPHLNYYQGYHDVAITFLLVVGEELGFHIVERLSAGKQLREFMTPTMERTTYLLHFMYPVIKQECPELYDYMEQSEVGTIFALPWLITWFSHVLPNYKDVVRLFDFFLAHAQSPMMPVYLATAIVLHRQNEVLMGGPENCDMAYVHGLLSRIPVSDSLPIEKLLVSAKCLHDKYPSTSIEKDVKARIKRQDDELKAAKQKHEELKKRLQQKPKKDWGDKNVRPWSDEGGFGKFITESGKFLVFAAPVIVGIVVWRYFYHVKVSLPL